MIGKSLFPAYSARLTRGVSHSSESDFNSAGPVPIKNVAIIKANEIIACGKALFRENAHAASAKKNRIENEIGRIEESSGGQSRIARKIAGESMSAAPDAVAIKPVQIAKYMDGLRLGNSPLREIRSSSARATQIASIGKAGKV